MGQKPNLLIIILVENQNGLVYMVYSKNIQFTYEIQKVIAPCLALRYGECAILWHKYEIILRSRKHSLGGSSVGSLIFSDKGN